MSPKAIIFLQIWGTVGPLVGIGLGTFLTRSWQRKQWIMESKKAEYRELLSVLANSVHCYLKVWPCPMPVNVISAAEEQELLNANANARKTIQDRIFIARFVQDENILERWQLIAAEKGERTMEYWNALHSTIVKAAHADLRIKD